MRRNLNNVVYVCCIIRNQLNCSKFLYLVHLSFSTHVDLLLILALPPPSPQLFCMCLVMNTLNKKLPHA